MASRGTGASLRLRTAALGLVLLLPACAMAPCACHPAYPAQVPVFGLVNETDAEAQAEQMLPAQQTHDMRGGKEAEETSDFGSLDSMLQWAISHSDAEQLSAAAQEVQTMSPEQLALKRQHIKDVVEAMRMPSDAELMKVAISDLLSQSPSREILMRALEELLHFVEPIDNANDLHKLGGLAAIANVLQHADAEVRTAAAWVAGKAAQNNPTVQRQLLDEGLLKLLLAMTTAPDVEEAVKALYAVSACIRNHVEGQEAFYDWGGTEHLVRLMGATSDVRLRRKAVFLAGALAEEQSEGKTSVQPMSQRLTTPLLCGVLELTLDDGDLDMQEKALQALQSLMNVGPSVRQLLREECEAAAVLRRCKEVLQNAAASDPSVAEYAEEVDMLRQDVESHLLERDM